MKYCCDLVDIVDKMCHVDQTFASGTKSSLFDGHCIAGVFECAHVLEMNPEHVLYCILPSSSAAIDISLKIQHTLIEAYCLENEIEVFKPNSIEEIRSLLKISNLEGMDLSCILICDKEISSVDSETDYTDLESDDELYEWPS